ncbi:YfcC family protein [Oceanobacillus jeddahense]|uniref:YfcC family protein n=1 Tax=Oceanobacillus jeddahense TaxID=1462527 RepID=UPI000AD6AED8|nr:AbgT family transporter [Oceanobacillus jeddahense]
MNKKRKMAMPDAIVILFFLLILAWIVSFIIPSGEFERSTDGLETVIPNSFSSVDAPNLGIMDVFLSIQQGLIESANLIFLVLIMGGAIAVIEYPGTINAGVKVMVDKTRNRKYLLIASVSLLFGIISTVGVGSNAVIAFIPLGIILAKALDLDAIAGVAIIYLGYFAGSAAAVFDPIILGVAQEIAGLPLFSGAIFRIFIFIALIVVTILFVTRYVKRISEDPSKSLMGEQKFAEKDMDETHIEKFNTAHKIIILFFFLCIGVFVYGSLALGWGINELAAIFLINAIGTAIISKQSPNQFVKSFMGGARNILYGALIIGIARSIIVLMENGLILDTVVNAIFIPLSEMGTLFGALAMFFFNLIFNILVPSGSGQAAVVMPIMTPLADMLDITRQTAVVAFKLGDGITNMITPISGVLMAVLAIGGIPYTKWIRFIMPLVLYWAIVGIAFVMIATLIGYGPF